MKSLRLRKPTFATAAYCVLAVVLALLCAGAVFCPWMKAEIARFGPLAAGIAAAGTIVFADIYGIRRTMHLKPTRVDVAASLGKVKEAAANLQAEANTRGLGAREVKRRADRILDKHSLRGIFRISVEVGEGGRVSPALAGVAGLVLVFWHSRMEFRGALPMACALLFGLVVLNGFVGSALYYLGPRLLMKRETDEAAEARFRRIVRLWLIVHVVLSGALTAAVIAHILAWICY